MTQQQAITAYQQKYAAFPDLLTRIESQFDFEYWQTNNPEEEISVSRAGSPEDMQEDKRFWSLLADTESKRPIEREDIDFLYRVLNIEQ